MNYSPWPSFYNTATLKFTPQTLGKLIEMICSFPKLEFAVIWLIQARLIPSFLTYRIQLKFISQMQALPPNMLLIGNMQVGAPSHISTHLRVKGVEIASKSIYLITHCWVPQACTFQIQYVRDEFATIIKAMQSGYSGNCSYSIAGS